MKSYRDPNPFLSSSRFDSFPIRLIFPTVFVLVASGIESVRADDPESPSSPATTVIPRFEGDGQSITPDVLSAAANQSMALSPHNENAVPAHPDVTNPPTARDGLSVIPAQAGIQQSVDLNAESHLAGIANPSERELTINRPAVQGSKAVEQAPWYRQGITSLLVVLALIAMSAWLAKRFFKNSHAVGNEWLSVLSRTHLSPKQSIALVQTGTKLTFVGISPGNVNVLRVVEDPEEVAVIRGQLRLRQVPGASPFDSQLERQAERFAERTDSDDGFVPNASERMTSARRDVRGLLEHLRSRQRA